jgi:CheY-like chemotaxis protein
VLLSVTDTGQGMSEETRQHLFEPFFTTKEKGRGTGLGLSTVYGIVQQGNGYIEVQSEPGRGTSFNIYLPRIEDNGPQPEPPQAVAAELRGSETVLVVEDQDDVRRLMVAALRSYGYRALEAPGGRAALEEAARHPARIDLLLTDVIMPDMNGKELADRLAPLRPAMKVLFTSGYSGEVVAHRGVLDSGVAYLPKPFTPVALAAKVREVLGTAAV